MTRREKLSISHNEYIIRHDDSTKKVIKAFKDQLSEDKEPGWQNPGISCLARVCGTINDINLPKGMILLATGASDYAVAIQLQSLLRHFNNNAKIRLENAKKGEVLVINRWGTMREKIGTNSQEDLVRLLNASIALCPPRERWSAFRTIFGEASDFVKRALNGHAHKNLCLVEFENGWRLVLNDGVKKVFGPLKRKMTLLPSSSQSGSREILAGICDTEKEFNGRGFTISQEFRKAYPEKSEELLGLACLLA